VDRRADRHDKANSPFSQSCKSSFLGGWGGWGAGTVYILRKGSQETSDPTLVVKFKAVLSSPGLHVLGPN